MGTYKDIKTFIDNILGVKIIYEGSSDYGHLKVYEKKGTINLTSQGEFVQSSYNPAKKPIGSVWDYFLTAPLFHKSPEKVRNICILGLGAGTAVKLLNNVYKIENIVGVEVDKKIVKLAREYFDLHDKNLEIVIQDAAEYVKRRTRLFDLIIVDIYLGDKVPLKCNTSEFFKSVINLLNPHGVLLVNRSKKDDKPPISNLFKNIYTLKVRNNIFYYFLKKPIDKNKILERFCIYAQKHEFMEFLKQYDKINLSILRP